MLRPVPRTRLRLANDAPIRAERDYVLLWITAHRRVEDCFTTDHAVELARALGKPLVVLEALRVGYPHASERLHRFVLDGMADLAALVGATRATHLAYVERHPGEGSELLATLASRAAVVVTDDHPGFFLPRMVAAAARRVDVRVVAVDSNGLVPMRLFTPLHATAYSFRRELQKLLPPQLEIAPSSRPLESLPDVPIATLPKDVERYAFLGEDELRRATFLTDLPIDHGVRSIPNRRGGSIAALATLERFARERLGKYLERANPDSDASSELSPYLHFGHLGVHRVLRAVAPTLAPHALTPNGGRREGFYGLAPEVEAFLDQLVTWRDLGFHAALHDPLHDRYEGVPAWARATLAAHAGDPRPERYDRATLEHAATRDPIWNAAQRELLETGSIHNYLRMLWGKKVLEWSDSPAEAFEVLVELNDRYALDGRDANSYSGIGWIFGRYDRPWAPKRPIFGTIRYMSSANTKKKLDLDRYLARYGDSLPLFGGPFAVRRL